MNRVYFQRLSLRSLQKMKNQEKGMERKKGIKTAIMIALAFLTMIMLTFNLRPAEAQLGSIIINPDGSITPGGAPISNTSNYYYLTSDISYPTYNGIVVQKNDTVVDGNGYEVQGSGTADGFKLYQVSNVTIENMNVANFSRGISIENSNCTSVIGDNITYCSGYGVYASDSTNTIVSGSNVVSCTEYGIWSDTCNFTVLYKDNVSSTNDDGIDIWNSNGNTINESVILGNNGIGIRMLGSCHNDTMIGNVISGNNGIGICMPDSYNDTMIDNVISGNNGTGIDYSAGVSSSVVAIGDSIISGNYGEGISISSSSNVNMTNDIVNDNAGGISLLNCPNAQVNGNSISGNHGDGIYLNSSYYENASSNQISYNNLYGIHLYNSSSGSVRENSIENNTNGIYLLQTSNTTIVDNQVTNQSSCGIIISGYGYGGHTIYHNNFISNNPQALFYGLPTDVQNYWDDGYPSGGNYWSDYQTKYPNASEIDSSVIWNTPYVIGSNNIDNFPLIIPYGSTPQFYWLNITSSSTTGGTTYPAPGSYEYLQGQTVLVQAINHTGYYLDHWELDTVNVGVLNPASVLMNATHVLKAVFAKTPGLTSNITITNVTSQKHVIFQNFNGTVTVTVQNGGEYFESFNVTLYANTSEITMFSDVTLDVGNSTTLTFTWNTTGLLKGNYTITAYVSLVPDETNNGTNNFTGGWVSVSHVGDLTGGSANAWDFVPDGVVDGKDISIVCLCFGSSPTTLPPVRWNPNCDINNDGVVDGKDIAIVAAHFGEKDP
jgi:parallel beta-helix repeat protein